MLRPFLLAFTVAAAVTPQCGGGSSTTTPGATASVQNFQSITVNAGPANNYFNGAFTTVTVCVPGQSSCQTIDGVLVDTGSSGLRVLASSLTLALPQQTDASGAPVVECLPFLDGFTWGPVQTADIKLGGEQASAVPMQVIGGPGAPAIPAACARLGRAGKHARHARRQRHPGRRSLPAGLRVRVRRRRLLESRAVLRMPLVGMPDHRGVADAAGAESGLAVSDRQQRRDHPVAVGPHRRRADGHRHDGLRHRHPERQRARLGARC